MTTLDRRAFLTASLAGAAAWAHRPPSFVRALFGGPREGGWGGPGGAHDGRLLVILQLRGGNDGLNTVVPREDDDYYRARPALAIPPKALLPLDDLNGFHPALAQLSKRYASGGMCIVQNVGAPHPNLSHFRSLDVWDAGLTDERLPTHGWLGRLADQSRDSETNPVARLAIGREVMPLALRAATRLGCAIPDLDTYSVRSGPTRAMDQADQRLRAIEALNEPAGGSDLAPLTDAATAARLSLDDLARVRKIQTRVSFPATKLSADLSLVARVMASGLPVRVAYVTLDGFDTHAQQAGTHANLLRRLDGALDAFLAELAARELLDRTLVMTISEFGRRVAQNGDGATAGSDHGAASLSMFFGGRVQGGMLAGQPRLSALDENGNQRLSVDFRQLYATVIEDWMGGAAAPVLGGSFEKLGIWST